MFGQDRDQLRRFFVTSWQKRRNGEPLQALEMLVADVVDQHPEYQADMVGDDALARDFSPDGEQTNPWLHMGMHVSLGEQLGADRPAGIRDIHRKIITRLGDAHAAEHAMMECLGMALWEAQRDNRHPDEAAYLDCLRKLAG